MEKAFEEIVLGDLERFQEKVGLGPNSDVQMILLKAHLLIEEQLQAFIDGTVSSAEPLSKARFTFAHKLALSEALHEDANCFGYGWVWQSIRELNTLRNRMAHNLEPKDFEGHVASLARSIDAHLPVEVVPGEGEFYEMARFGCAVSILNLCLARLLRSKHYSPE